MPSGGTAVALAEPVEYEGQDIGRDTLARVADHNLQVRVDPQDVDLDSAASRSEFDGIREQIPYRLLKALTVTVDAAAALVHDSLDPDAFRVGAWLDGGPGARPNRAHVHHFYVPNQP